jgi:transposase InsO family protein
MSDPVAFRISPDRTLAVPPGQVVRTGWVDVFACRLANRERMAVGDVAEAFQRRLQAGRAQPFPCPNGRWAGDAFEIFDGRHEWVAAVMLGHARILVAWVEAEGDGE